MPQPTFSDEKIMASADQFVPCVRRWFDDEPVLFVEAQGAELIDSKGRRYLDLLCSHGVATLIGYNHPAVVEALQQQAGRLYALSVEFPNLPAMELAARLLEVTHPSLDQLYFANAGTEAVEAALFVAKKHTRKYEIATLYGDFHGRSHGSRSLLGFAPLKKGMGPLLPGVVRIPSYNCYRCHLGLTHPDCDLQCARMLEEALLYDSCGEVACFIAEPVQGTAGNIPAPDGYFQVIKKILDQHDILFFMDEIFTSFGSTGKKFCYQHYDVVPDFVTLSKTLGGGVPISAFLTRQTIARDFAAPEPPQYFTTYGSNPLMAAAALASLNTIIAERPWERAAELGSYWMTGLKKLQAKHEIIGDVRGKGVMIGVELVTDRRTKAPAKAESLALRKEAGKRGLILPAGLGWFGNTIRMAPSVKMTPEQIDQALHIMDISLMAIR